ncbi:MAG: M48 family metallopeptidase [Alphaproteobacteria bacterium]|nr:M48 family metallopeptidase [Alphaproteobacteria bacterium]
MIQSELSDLTPTIVRSARRRRSLALYVENDGSLRVLVPMKTSLRSIQAFILERTTWIKKQRQALKNNEDSLKLPSLCDGMMIPFQGQDLRLVLEHRDAPLTCADETCLNMAFPLKNLTPALLESEIKTALTLWYKKQARQILPQKLAAWAAVMNLKPRAVFITSPRQRWGSCSAQDEIRLNWRLIMTHPLLLDYLVIHELAHIKHKNHGKRFWNLVEKFAPQSKETRARLRKFEKSPFLKLFE